MNITKEREDRARKVNQCVVKAWLHLPFVMVAGGATGHLAVANTGWAVVTAIVATVLFASMVRQMYRTYEYINCATG